VRVDRVLDGGEPGLLPKVPGAKPPEVVVRVGSVKGQDQVDEGPPGPWVVVVVVFVVGGGEKVEMRASEFVCLLSTLPSPRQREIKKAK
jgi:hypothetical protein